MSTNHFQFFPVSKWAVFFRVDLLTEYCFPHIFRQKITIVYLTDHVKLIRNKSSSLNGEMCLSHVRSLHILNGLKDARSLCDTHYVTISEKNSKYPSRRYKML